MNYTLNQLKVFLKITQAQSITKAAEELHLTQPAVSIQLRNFQGQFELPLTEVVGRKIYITDFGKEIAQAAESILKQVASIDSRAGSFKGQLTGRLKISIVTTGTYVMPYFLSPFMKQHKNLDLLMDVTNRGRVIESLEQNAVDFSLLSFLPDTLAVEKLDLLENRFFLVGSGHENFRKAQYPKTILKELPLIFREQGSGTRLAMENYIKANRLSITPKMVLTSNEAVKEAVVSGLGYSIMPLTGIKNELKNGSLKIISVAGFPIKSTWRLVWLKGKQHSPAASAFLAYVRKEKNAIVSAHFSYAT